MNFSGEFGNDQTIWYPASGYRYSDDGSLTDVGYSGDYWSGSPGNDGAYDLYFNYHGRVNPSSGGNRASGQSVRCFRE